MNRASGSWRLSAMEVISTDFVFQEKKISSGRRFSRSTQRKNRVLNGFSSVWFLPFFLFLRRESAPGRFPFRKKIKFAVGNSDLCYDESITTILTRRGLIFGFGSSGILAMRPFRHLGHRVTSPPVTLFIVSSAISSRFSGGWPISNRAGSAKLRMHSTLSFYTREESEITDF